MPTLEDLENLWIRFEALDGMTYEQHQWTVLLEALELLDLLVRVDAVTGWQCLFSVVSQPHRFRSFADVMFPYHKSVFIALRRMIGEDDQPWEPPSSSEFARVKQRLLDAWARENGGRAFDRGREGRIAVKLTVLFSDDFQAQSVMMQDILELALASHTLLLRDEEITPAGSEPVAGGDADAEQLQVRKRRAVFCFEAVDVEVVEHLTTNERRRVIFLEMLGVWSARGLKRFEYTCGRFDHDTVGAVCSALALSQTISKFAFTKSDTGHGADRSAWWPWLAYALFSQDAKRNIQSVQLNVHDFTMSNVDAMHAVLNHAKPLAYVCALDELEPKSPVLSTPPTAALLKPRTRVAIGHRIVITHGENFVDRGTASVTTNTLYQIVRDNETEDFIEIVFPGSGVAWIDRADVQKIVSTVLELLRLVSGDLESLKLDSFEPLSDEFLTTVCSVCPVLKSLSLGYYVDSMRWLLSPTNVGESRCLLERLDVNAQVTDHASVGAFFKALNGGDHEINKLLRALSFGGPWRKLESDPMPAELCIQWLEILRSNRRLEQCVFKCTEKSDAVTKIQDEVCEHNGERIVVPQTLAFLIVLMDPSQRSGGRKRLKSSATTPDSVLARFKLPRETIKLVLEMTGVPLRRICA